MFNKLYSLFSGNTSSREVSGEERGFGRKKSQEIAGSAGFSPKKEPGFAINGTETLPPSGRSSRAGDHANRHARTPTIEQRPPEEAKREIKYIETTNTHDYRAETRRPSERSRKLLMERVQSLKDDKLTLTTVLQTTQKSLLDADVRSENLQRSLQQLKAEKDKWSAERAQLLMKERARDKERRELEEAGRRQDGEIRRLQEKLRRSEERNAQLERLLDERTADLKGAQVFLTTADAYSGADVLKMVEGLNAEIFQISASMAELLDDHTMMASTEEQAKSIQVFEMYKEALRARIGNDLLNYLTTQRTKLRIDPLPLQLAFQAFLSWWCVYMTGRFCGGETGRDLVRVYQRIRDTESQAIAGRWRAMTTENLKLMNTENHAGFVTESILALLGICGWSRQGRESQNAILSIQAAVTSVAKLWSQLRVAMKEGITTVDMQVSTFDPGELYDEEKMEDIYGEAPSFGKRPASARSKERILCTVGIGLKRSTIKRSDNNVAYDHIEVSLKPKIALASVLTLAGSGPPSDASQEAR